MWRILCPRQSIAARNIDSGGSIGSDPSTSLLASLNLSQFLTVNGLSLRKMGACFTIAAGAVIESAGRAR